ncbi:MAG: YncE family protein [Hyalangium sp.]|uniref:YncE family protein n=1 Tax=Hyalangium sp. TaxID=2028555 RepID=UPI00389AD58E
MKNGILSCVFRVTSVLTMCLAAAPARAAEPHVLKQFEFDKEGGWDYLTVDSQARHVYLSHGSHVLVVDADSGKQIGDIPNTPGVHGVALAPELGKGFISDGRAGDVTIFELESRKVLGTVKAGENPDAILFDPASKRVFVFNGRSHDATVIDAATHAIAGTLALGGKPEFAVTDGQGQVFVNLEDKAELLALDPKKLAITHRWPLAPCEEPTGLALDAAHRRLFAGCSNKLMAVVDANTGKLITTLPIGAGVDGTAFDADRQLAFSSNGEGTLTVIHEDSPEKFSVVATVKTEPGARTLALDPKSHHIYLVTGPRKGETGTFKLLVVGTE